MLDLVPFLTALQIEPYVDPSVSELVNLNDIVTLSLGEYQDIEKVLKIEQQKQIVDGGQEKSQLNRIAD